MTKLNLTANDKPQELILAYLQENASDVLAEKINNGMSFEKDGKQLVNKKTLNGFMKYASSEAKKLAEKGANSACVEDSVVYGWAIHYFEEDSIEGTLYNDDGTEYKPVVKTAPKPVTTPVTAKPKETNTQTSLWDMLKTKEPKEEPIDESEPTEVETVNEENDEIPDPSIDEIADKLQQAVDDKSNVKPEPSPLYSQYLSVKKQYSKDIILIRLGDFYESFGDDATMLSNELNLTLTSRNVGLAERVSMIGFPYHAAENYFNKIREKHGITVIESDGKTFSLSQTVQQDGKVIDTETGVVLSAETADKSTAVCPFDQNQVLYLCNLLDGKIDIA